MRNDKIKDRRPLKVRENQSAKKTAQWLSRQNVTPNQISILIVFFAGLAATCLYLISIFSGFLFMAVALLAATFIQCRLLCNLFDGMVAVEGGKSSPAGELFNDIPDRIAAPLIIVAAGYGICAQNDCFAGSNLTTKFIVKPPLQKKQTEDNIYHT